MKLKELLFKDRSYRGFDRTVKINYEELSEMIDNTRYAPSSINLQPLKYKITIEEEECEKMLSFTHYASKIKNLKLPLPGKEPVAYITICHDTSITPETDKFMRDVGICAQVILMTAIDMGYGGCMIGSFSAEGVNETLGLTDNLKPKLVIALGKPDEDIVLTDMTDDNTDYFRNEDNSIHYVPKRSLEDIIIK